MHHTTDQGVRTVPCYNCGEGRADYYARENGYTLVRCVTCGLLYVNPRPELEDMASATQVGVHVGEQELNTTGHFNPFRVRAYRGVLRDLYGSDLFQQQRRWLDLGCGHGEFLMALGRYGRGKVSARGYEPNAQKMRGAYSRGLSVSDVYPKDGEASLDVVSALNVYSHLDDPSKEIARWARLLAPGGELVLRTGDTAHMPASSHPRPFHLPDHLSFASERIVTGILHGSGFEVVAVRKYPLLPLSADLLALETAKAFMPGRTSRLRQMLNPRCRSDDCRIDMWIRARFSPAQKDDKNAPSVSEAPALERMWP